MRKTIALHRTLWSRNYVSISCFEYLREVRWNKDNENSRKNKKRKRKDMRDKVEESDVKDNEVITEMTNDKSYKDYTWGHKL